MRVSSYGSALGPRVGVSGIAVADRFALIGAAGGTKITKVSGVGSAVMQHSPFHRTVCQNNASSW